MIGQVAILAEFEAQDGLNIQIALNVADPEGAADVAVSEILERIQDYIDGQDRVDDLLSGGGAIFVPEGDYIIGDDY